MYMLNAPEDSSPYASLIEERKRKLKEEPVGMTDVMAKEAEKSDVSGSLGGGGMSDANKAAVALAVLKALQGANKAYLQQYADTKANKEKQLGILSQGASLFG